MIAAVGTTLPMLAELLQDGVGIPPAVADLFDATAVLDAIATGLSELDCVAIVATGGIAVPDRARGHDVHLVYQLPQPLLLRCAQLFVIHGGYNSIMEAVVTGTPMAVTPGSATGQATPTVSRHSVWVGASPASVRNRRPERS